MHRLLLPALVAGSVLATVVAAPAQAATATGPTTGWDVSYPQCASAGSSATTPLPAQADFAVVGVNGGTAVEPNPCFATERAWALTASGIGHAATDLYVNTADPDPAAAAFWPTGDTTRGGRSVRSPYGSCHGDASPTSRACSWVYGASLADDDVRTMGVTGSVGRWWLDVEPRTTNSWSTSTARNRAVLEGMTAAFTTAGQHVGLYATASLLHDILGSVPSSSRLHGLPSWVAGAKDRTGAAKRCSGAPLAAGRVQLVQWRDGALDRDLACATLTSKKPSFSGTRRAGDRLTAHAGHWGPGTVHLAYRWTRNGKPITKATHRTYRLGSRDRGARIAVVVTGTENGYSRSVRTSTAHRVHR